MSTSPVAKLYHFNPNTYDTVYFVAAYSRDEAIEHVREWIRTKGNAATAFGYDSEEDRARDIAAELLELDDYINEVKHQWDDHAHCIEEYPIGHVVQTEIS